MDLVLLPDDVPVTVTKEERHQRELAPYRPVGEARRAVVVELTWCVITTGKYKGTNGIEVRLDGHRVGELTKAMSDRYTPFVDAVLRTGSRAGCAAEVFNGTRGVEVELRLPHPASTPAAPPAPRPPIPAPSARVPRPTPAPHPTVRVPGPPAAWSAPVPPPRGESTSSKSPLWIGGGVVGVILVAALIGGGEDEPSSTATGSTTTVTTTTSAPPTTTTTTPPPPPPVTSVVAAPPPAPPQPAAPKPTTTTAKPRTTTPRPAPTTPPPAPKPPPNKCHPSYSPCVPVASDVDCAGGSGNGPVYVTGPIRVIGPDEYGLDGNDNDGIGCE